MIHIFNEEFDHYLSPSGPYGKLILIVYFFEINIGLLFQALMVLDLDFYHTTKNWESKFLFVLLLFVFVFLKNGE